MKKYLLYLSVSFLSFGLLAQNPCPTCHQGTKGTMVQSLAPNNFANNSNQSNTQARVGNGNGTLGQSYVLQNVCGLNYTQASQLTETRSAIYAFNANGTGFPTSLAISGLPCGGNGNIEKAYVYYEASYTEATPPSTTVTMTNPVPSTSTTASTLIGQAGPKCWGETGCAAYRCDVTAQISGNGTYKISLNGFANAAWEVDGVTLIIIYKNPAVTYSGSISLWDGCIVNYYVLGAQTYSGFTACAATSTANAFGVYGDIQINVNGGLNTDKFNGTTGTFPNIFWNFNDINTTLTGGQTTCVYNSYTNNAGDCYAWILAGLYWQNTTCMACTASSTMTLTTTQVNPTCGNNNGSATVNVAGGSGPYTYLWSPGGQTNATATGLSAGSYTVTVSSAGGCTPTANIVVVLTTGSLSVTASGTGVKCNGNCNGTATASITGGTAPFTYTWAPSGGTGATASGLCAGTYTVTVKDANGCTGTASFIVTQPPVLAMTTTFIDDKCNGGSNGSATANVTGGTPAYTYLWSPGGNTNSTATGLTAGTYTITVTDANGCQVVANIIISQPPPMTVNIIGTTNVLCNGANTGSISTNVSGGATPYTYLWAPNGGTNATGTGLSAGTYTLTVTDNNGCTQTISAVVTQPTPLTVSTTVLTNVLCNGGANGSASASGSGGTPSYNYSWTPSGGNNSNAGGLSAGNYTVTITDANGCTATASISISQPTPMTSTTSFTQATCNLANGSATVNMAGGTPAYNYSWAPGGNTNPTATGLAAGSYTVYVTDANGCSYSTTVLITQPSTVSASISSSTNVSCNGGSNGSATVSAVNGPTPYVYSWSPVAGTNATVTGLSAGTYTCTITDANGCTSTASIIITEPAVLTVAITTTVNVSCNGGNNGSATASGSGGTSAYNYAWTPIGGNSATGVGFSAGTYTCTITDANGCTATASVSITEPPVLTAVITATVNVLCNGGNTGSSTVTAGGGTPNYAYNWSPNGGNSATGTGLTAGTYTCTITDADGCTATASTIISQPPVLTATISSTTGAGCNGGNNGTATVVAGGGTPAYVYQWSPIGGTNATGTGFSAGTYFVTITDANGCTASVSVLITQPATLQVSISAVTNVSCNGGNNGTASTSVVGGTGPYTYAWTPAGGTNSTGTGLSAGTFNVLVTDSNGCTASVDVTIAQPNVLTLSVTVNTNVNCFGQSNGSIIATVGGGTPSYNYTWTPSGGNNSTASGLSAGTYSVSVVDANGCTITASAVVTQPQVLTATAITTQNIACFGDNDGIASVSGTGGTIPYTYYWNPGGNSNAVATGLTAGSYVVTITDAAGCTATANATLTQPTVLATTLTIVNVACYGGNTGSITTTTTGGTTPYAFSWSNGQNGANATNLSIGVDTLIITDANGCTVSAVATITEPPVLSITASGPQSVCSGAATTLISNASGGTLPYAYQWSPAGGTTATTTTNPIFTTIYTITVTDANGCTATATVDVHVSAPLVLNVTGDTIICPGQTVYIHATASGGDGIYHYLWLPSNGTTQWATFTPSGDTTITIEVTDNCGSAMQTRVINIIVVPFPKPAFLTSSNTGCYPLCVQFRDITVTGSGTINSWEWNFGDGDTSNTSTPIHCYKDSGTFTVTLTVANTTGCSGTLKNLNLIKVYPHPTANFTYSPNPVNILTPLVQYTDRSTDQYPIVAWFWTFGDGTSTWDENPSHTFSDTGLYCTSLAVTDEHGCADTTIQCVDVEPMFTFYIPNGFTPNGDGINDVFQPKGTFVKSYEMYIYDRWGSELYHTTNFENGWNGELNNTGQPCQEDTYVYLIYVYDTQNVKHTYTGKINLIR